MLHYTLNDIPWYAKAIIGTIVGGSILRDKIVDAAKKIGGAVKPKEKP